MTAADLTHCLTLLNEVDDVLTTSGESLVAAHLSLVIALLHAKADAPVLPTEPAARA